MLQFGSIIEFENIFKINFVKHGDKSNVNNLYKDIIPFALFCAEITI